MEPDQTQPEWLNCLRADPLPWLLACENPSARFLALHHLCGLPEQNSQTSEARAAILAWLPVREILAAMDPVSFWGHADKPFYGGAVSTHATLCLLADLGAPRTPQIEAACENLLAHGQHASGGFSHDGTPDRVLTCYTGNAVCTLLHFGYHGDARLRAALKHLAARSVAPGGLACPYADGEECQWGITKVLKAFAALPPSDRIGQARAILALADAVLDYTFDFGGRDANWLELGFPLDYQSDLVELCDVLARLGFGSDPRAGSLLNRMLAAQTGEGRWIKQNCTRAFQVEERNSPSKWITIRALRALKNAHQIDDQHEEAGGRGAG